MVANVNTVSKEEIDYAIPQKRHKLRQTRLTRLYYRVKRNVRNFREARRDQVFMSSNFKLDN